MSYSEVKNIINDGLAGKNKGLPLGLPTFDSVLNGLRRGVYYTIFAAGGVGKSSFTWINMCLNPILFARKNNIKIRVFLYSLEVVKSEVIAKLICNLMYRKHNIIISPDYMYSRTNDKLDPDLIPKIDECGAIIDDLINKKILIINDLPRTPSDIKRDIQNYANKNGTTYTDQNGDERYKPNNPDEYVLIITDTVGNLIGDRPKQTIDEHSANCRSLYRDFYNYIPINVSHSNRDMNEQRARTGEVFPMLSDIKETNMLEQDSSVVLTLFNPISYVNISKKLDSFLDYKIPQLGDRFRCIGILKNRHGINNVRKGMLYIGECAMFRELPRGSLMTPEQYTEVNRMKSYNKNGSTTNKDKTDTQQS